MSTLDQVYKCDACEKEETWGDGVADRWISVEVSATSFGSRRPTKRRHACSTACERKLHLIFAGEKPTQEQLDAEARAAWPDLAKQLDEVKAAGERELSDMRAELVRIEAVNAGLRDKLRTDAETPVAREELRDLFRSLIDERRAPGRTVRAEFGPSVRTRQEIEERIKWHEGDLDGWQESGGAGLISLVPTEPDPEKREFIRRELKVAILVLRWVLGEDSR